MPTKVLYHYQMYDVDVSTYLAKQTQLYEAKDMNQSMQFPFKSFQSIEQAKTDIKHKLIPHTAEQLSETSWSLSEDKQTLTKTLVFDTKQKRQEYQEAVERAWALINHLDYRAKTQEGQTIEL